ncbi:Co2+/Mg2+ efflux protein ApaG [Ferrimonas gelatinilytica]|uniref:Co2+/Mg2+ efflux protein ApaG n=1 Tax=Ferrimonas gelatinilytica TaxID=1255257 RepID=A0ABP9S104_9GAMM
MRPENPLHIEVETHFLPEHSDPQQSRYAFAYTLTLTNLSETTLTLQRRHWLIIDGDGRQSEVEGEGVVGETPVLPPGGRYRYTSSVIFPTPVGTMQGFYTLSGASGQVKASIEPFTFRQPGAVH